MNRRIGKALIAFCLLFPSLPLAADSFAEAEVWLERMASAMQQLDYQGTFVYVRGNDVETMRLTHVRVGGVVHERMVAVSGPQREIMRDENGVRAILGNQSQPLQDPMFTGAVFPDFSIPALTQAKDRYLFEVGGVGRIAGHQGRKISIIPRDQYRYGYELWLEEESGLLLRWVLYDPERRALAKLMFTDLVTGAAVDRAGLESATPPQRFVAVQQASPKLERPAAAGAPESGPEGVPPGFGLAAHSRADGALEFEHLVYSDGLASVSVYLESSTQPGGIAPGLTRMGTTSAWSGREGARRVTAVGEVPPLTLKTFGEAFLASQSDD
jgi:sigma-E factor negative regulatory protein RseB